MVGFNYPLVTNSPFAAAISIRILALEYEGWAYFTSVCSIGNSLCPEGLRNNIEYRSNKYNQIGTSSLMLFQSIPSDEISDFSSISPIDFIVHFREKSRWTIILRKWNWMKCFLQIVFNRKHLLQIHFKVKLIIKYIFMTIIVILWIRIISVQFKQKLIEHFTLLSTNSWAIWNGCLKWNDVHSLVIIFVIELSHCFL